MGTLGILLLDKFLAVVGLETKKNIKVMEWLLLNTKYGIFQLWLEQVTFQWDDDDVCYVLDQQG
jgi:hypothetical protein